MGGKENIAAVSHCMTRMRFVLRAPQKADVKKIEAMKVVKGSFTQTGQFQVIIGNTVADFYNDFIAVSGIEGVSKDAVKNAAKQNQNLLQRMITALAEIFAPLIPAIITGGLILGFRNCIDSLYLFENGAKTLCDMSQFWTGIDSFLWLIGEAVFHMLPVGICWSVTKKMGTTQMLGIVLGLTLVSGQLLNAYSVAGATEIPFWDFGFFQINMIGYQAQVIPAILAAFTLVYLEKFFRKITPQVVSMIVVPFCSLLLAVMASHFILGPIGWKIGSAISSVVYAGITGSFKIVFGAVFGFVYAPLVITGLHHMSNAIDLQLIADYEGTMLWPMIALSNIAQGSGGSWYDCLAKKECTSAGSECAILYFLLSGSNGTSHLWCQFKACVSICLWNGWFCLCICSLRGNGNSCKCNRCRWSARDSFDSSYFYGELCNLYGDCNCSAFCADNSCGKEKITGGCML